MEDTAMAEAGDKDNHYCLVQHSKKNKKTKEGVTEEGIVQHTFIYPMQILLTANKSSTKSMQDCTYNPIPKTKTLLLTMAKGDLGMTLTSTDLKKYNHYYKGHIP